MAAKTKTKAKKPRTEPSLDEFISWFRQRPGNQPIGIAIRDVLAAPTPSVQQVQAAVDLMDNDSRFLVTRGGISVIDAVARLTDQEPEEVTVDGPPVEIETPADPQPDIPADVETKSIGEHVADAESKQMDVAETKPESQDSEVAVLEQQRATDAQMANEEWKQRIKDIEASIKAEEQTLSSVNRHRKEVQARIKELSEDRREAIEGEPQARLTEMRAKEQAKIDATPIGQAIRQGTTAAPAIDAREFSARPMGMEAAKLGKTELDCPFTRETNAKGLTQWFAGFREYHRADHSEREAQVQALFRDALVEAALPCNGMLPPGEECPRVKTVEWDERKHLVLDLLAANEGPEGNVERWTLCPLYSRDEWASLYEPEYGPSIAGVDANDEAKAIRIRGGIDAGRLVKAGRSKLVCGPLKSIAVVVVKVEQQAAEATS